MDWFTGMDLDLLYDPQQPSAEDGMIELERRSVIADFL
jgi:hypothetical protein